MLIVRRNTILWRLSRGLESERNHVVGVHEPSRLHIPYRREGECDANASCSRYRYVSADAPADKPQWHLGFTSWEHTPTFRGFSSFYGFYGCAQDYYLHGSVGSLDFHHDKRPRCGEGCSEPQFAAVGNCSTAPGGNAVREPWHPLPPITFSCG
jgi:hypothetical protein